MRGGGMFIDYEDKSVLGKRNFMHHTNTSIGCKKMVMFHVHMYTVVWTCIQNFVKTKYDFV
jgi:hypothetical protein